MAQTKISLPEIVSRDEWLKERRKLLEKEKEFTRKHDELNAERRRLPIVEVDANIMLVGPDGPITLLETFEGRCQLIAYYHMWHEGKPAADQCEGCTFFNSQVRVHARGVTYATFCQGLYKPSVRYRDFMGWNVPWYSAKDSINKLRAGRTASFMLICYLRDEDRVFETYWTTGRGVEPMAPTLGLLDITVFGRQESWEDSPEGWPQNDGYNKSDRAWRSNGRPTAQWAYLEAGRSDDLGSDI